MFTKESIENIFTYHDDPAKVVHYQAIREAAKTFCMVLVEHTPMSADQTAAVRKLRECVMTANGAIALDGQS